MKILKKLILIALCIFINTKIVSASTETRERTEENNYGINKKLPHANITNAKKIPFVNANEKIYDYADILTDEEEKKVYESINKFIKETHMDMVFVSIDEKYTHKQVEDYACDFYGYNDFGIDFESYSGLILIRNNNTYADGKKYYYIATTGLARLYYADGGRLENILDDIYDDFVSDNYLEGIKKFANESISYYQKGYDHKYKTIFTKEVYIDENGNINAKPYIPIIIRVAGSSIITLITILILVSKNKMVRKAVKANEYLDKGSINYTQSMDQFVRSHTTHYTTSSSSGGGGSSHGGSSGFGHGGGGRSG